eukprot:Gb_21923 [translate_table: standard]
MNPNESAADALNSVIDIETWLQFLQRKPMDRANQLDEQLEMEIINIINNMNSKPSGSAGPILMTNKPGATCTAPLMYCGNFVATRPEEVLHVSTSVCSNFAADATVMTTVGLTSAATNTSTANSSTPATTACLTVNGGKPVKPKKKRFRASRRVPTTLLKTDTSNFKAMVQHFTGIPATTETTSSPVSSTVSDPVISSQEEPVVTKPSPHPAVCKIPSPSTSLSTTNTTTLSSSPYFRPPSSPLPSFPNYYQSHHDSCPFLLSSLFTNQSLHDISEDQSIAGIDAAFFEELGLNQAGGMSSGGVGYEQYGH